MFSIEALGLEIKNFKTHEQAKLHEAFCAGMRIDYKLTYDNGETKSVVFKKSEL